MTSQRLDRSSSIHPFLGTKELIEIFEKFPPYALYFTLGQFTCTKSLERKSDSFRNSS
jgi:hypothetical protein